MTGSDTSTSALPSRLQRSDLPARRLGPYVLLGLLGRGGMGEVYLAHDAVLCRQVAVKVLPAELAAEPPLVARFHAEAAAAARLQHPSVVAVYHHGLDGPVHYFAMQYVPGESLHQRLARRGRLLVGETLAILEDCLHGLGAAHDAGLVHRDFKPGNVLLDTRRPRPRAVLADFGLAKRIDGTRHTETGVLLGTVEYMAPEQGQGLPADARSDLYALGVVAYQMLAGRLPLRGRTPSEVLFKHSFERPQPLAEAAPGVPPVLAAVVDRLLAKDPAKRFPDCASVLDALGLASDATERTAAASATPDSFTATSPAPTPPSSDATWETVAMPPEERLAELTALIAEAEEVRRELTAQAEQHRGEAGRAGEDAEGVTETLRDRGECERLAEGLEAHAAAQQRLVDELRSEHGRVAAETAGFPQADKPRRRRLSFVFAACLLGAAAALLLWWLAGLRNGRDALDPAVTVAENVPQIEKEIELTPTLRDVRLLMTFEKKTFVVKDDKTTWVRDLSGYGNDLLCEGVRFDENGVAGGALFNDGKGRLQLPWSLVNNQPAFTIAAWVYFEDFHEAQHLYETVRLPQLTTPVFRGSIRQNRSLWSNSWHIENPGLWLREAVTTAPILDKGKWHFVALRLDEGGVGKGSYAIQVDDVILRESSQMIKQVGPLQDLIFRECRGRMDELAVWTRALSDEEIRRLREHGRARKVLLDAEQERKANPLRPPPPIPTVSPKRSYVLARLRPNFPKEQSWVNRVCFAPDGKQVYFGLDRNQGTGYYVGLLDLASGNVSCKIGYRGAIWGLDHTQAGGNLLLVGSYWAHEVGLFDGKTGETKGMLKGHTNAVWGVAFSRDGKLAVTSSIDKTTRVWGVKSGKELLRIESKRGIIMASSFSPDGTRLLGVDRTSTGGKDGAVCIWDLKKGGDPHVVIPHSQDVGDPAFLPDGDGESILVGGKEARLLNVKDGELIRRFVGARGWSVTFTADGQRFALAEPGRSAFRLWDFKSGRELARFVGHASHVTGVSFSPDGRLIATSSFDGTVKIWEVPDPPKAAKAG